MHAQQIFEQHESEPSVRRRNLNETRHYLSGGVHHGQSCVRQDRSRFARRLEPGDETETAVRQVRERVAGVDRERGHHRKHRPVKEFVEKLLLGRAELLFGAHHVHALSFQTRQQFFEKTCVLPRRQLPRHAGDCPQSFRRRHAVGTRLKIPLADAALQSGDAHHEEFIEVRAEDGEKLDPFEQWNLIVDGLFEHPTIEFHPRQFAIDKETFFHAPPLRQPYRSRGPVIVGPVDDIGATSS